MNLANVFDELGTQLGTIQGLRVYPYQTDAVQVPAALLSFPEALDFDLTYQRGGDRLSVALHVLVGMVVDRAARNDLGRFANGSGQDSIKEVLEQAAYTSFDSLRVTGATFQTFTVGAVSYVGATFMVDIVGSGS